MSIEIVFDGVRTFLPEDREIFVGKANEDTYMLKYTNKGEVTKVILSAEAFKATIAMGLEIIDPQDLT
ncbi:hypothetical protein [Ralstonia phage RSP15]|uniref:hypothetical protein n=1 Tax=Ralstonia phage RSP15 TaxID=1785960 RepID=UPI00074D4B31|nr:hypothetical protein BH754_gp056 [Ralstonia phage RSP15]BAU40014.1 hypothetical protein [Ralstonia phage RSP15]